MIKKELLKMPKLKATQYMLRRAKMDKPKSNVSDYYHHKKYNNWLYLRCCVKKGVLKVSFFLTETMRLGGTKPLYDIYFDKKNKKYITYSCQNEKWLTASICYLKWPTPWFASEGVYVCRETNKTLRKYFNTEEKGIEILTQYQNRVMAENLERKHRKQTDVWDADLRQTPKIPKGLKDWLNKESIPEHFIFYKYSRKKYKEGFCTYCENNVLVENPAYNSEGVCPHCHKNIVFKSIDKVGYFTTNDYPSYLIQRFKDGIMIRRFWSQRIYYRGAPFAPKLNFGEYRRIICNSSGEPLRAYYYGDYKHREMRWIEDNIHDTPSYWRREGLIYPNNLKPIVGRELRSTALIEWYKLKSIIDPEMFLSKIKEYPYLEKFIKAGLYNLADEKIKNGYSNTHFEIDKNATSLKKMLYIDSAKLKELKSLNEGSNYLSWLQYEKKSGKSLSKELKYWLINNNLLPKNLSFITNRMNIVQIFNYVSKQMQLTKLNCRDVIETWKDYLEMARKLGIDTSDEIIYRTSRLRQRHAELIKRLQDKDLNERAKEIIKSYPKLPSVFTYVKSKYEYVGDIFSVIAPDNIKDVLLEGRNLHHCVAEQDRYLDRIERQEAYILFLRRTIEPDVSFYTLEVEPGGTIRQKRTLYDRQNEDIEEATDFLKEWQGIIKKRLNKKDISLAKTSKILRLEEFAELDENNILIHGGELQGIRLVDVLMKDLMEAA